MCDLSYEESTSASSWRRIARSRVVHRCRSCGVDISVGSSYWRNFSVTDGRVADEAQCDGCHAIGERFGDEHRWTPAPSCLAEAVRGCVDYDGGGPWQAALDEIVSRGDSGCLVRKPTTADRVE